MHNARIAKNIIGDISIGVRSVVSRSMGEMDSDYYLDHPEGGDDWHWDGSDHVVFDPVICVPEDTANDAGNGSSGSSDNGGDNGTSDGTDNDYDDDWHGHGGYGDGGYGGGDDNGNSSDPIPPPVKPKDPCADLAKGKANPLKNMALKPPTANIKGATFGDNARKDKQGNFTVGHQGIDLDAPIGTPVYSMFEGVVSQNPISSQPNRIGASNDYPAGYIGDRNGAGNRIYITSTVNGQTITVAYFHLQAGDAIAKNPETGMPYS